MDIKEIINQLEQPTRKFPRDALVEAVRLKDQIVPDLLGLIEIPESLFEKCEQQQDYMGHVYALFLLAQFRITQAFPLIMNIYGYPIERAELLGEDLITEDLPRIVASVYEGDLDSLKNLIENEDADEFVREAMLKALLILVIYGEISREYFTDYCTFLMREKLERIPSILWCGLIKICGDLAERSFLEDIRGAYADDLVDPLYIQLDEVEDLIQRGWERNFKAMEKDTGNHLVEDVVREMEWWAFFSRPKQQNAAPQFPKSKKVPTMQGQNTSRPANPISPHKVGRNSPCPCGSGLKYKKCCGKRILQKELS